MNLKKSIRKVLREGNSLQSKLMQMMKTKGVDVTSKIVGGFDNLNKILKLDLDDLDVQEMLVKNFINFVEIPEIEVTGLEIKKSSSGNRIINILITTESNASNIESWLVRNIIEYLSGVFTFPIKAAWEPAFGGKPKISLSSELVEENDDGNITESVLSENKKTSLKEKLKNVVETQGIKMGVTIVGSLEKLFSILDIKGTQEDMIFLVKSIMDNEVEKQLKYCNYDIIKTLHSIKLYVFVAKPLPGEEETFDRLLNAVEEFISNLIYKLGGGLVRGHNVYVYNTGTNC